VIDLGLISWIVIGIISGWLAGLVMKGQGFGCLGNMIIGIIGALVGGWLAAALFNVPRAITGINISTIVVSFLGAVLILYIAGLLKK
jgi:uncharacterized membrane protein YeaQ/YmgE (transglycosylase-associated protein family)